MNRRRLSRFDVAMVVLAACASLMLLGMRFVPEWIAQHEARGVIDNIEAVARTVARHHERTGRWFPPQHPGEAPLHVLLDPFRASEPVYQNLDPTWLWRENNHGIVLQLVQFDADHDLGAGPDLFPKRMITGEPYLRLLLEFGAAGGRQARILDVVEHAFPSDAFIRVDGHLYAVDLRGLSHD